jgi:hypothetical protein
MSENYSVAYLTNTLTENWQGPSRLILCNTSIWSADPTSEEIFGSEIAQVNGYSRQTNTPVGDATYNPTTKEAEITMASASITASGGNITYSGYAILRSGSVATANKTATATNASDQITVTAHGLTAGDRVMLTADTGGTLPAGIEALTFYYASIVNTNTIQLYEEEALTTLRTFSTDGSGTLRLRYCQGEDGPRKNLGSDRTIADGNSHDFNGLKAYRF